MQISLCFVVLIITKNVYQNISTCSADCRCFCLWVGGFLAPFTRKCLKPGDGLNEDALFHLWMADYTVALNDKSFASIGITPLQIFTLSVVCVCGWNQADAEVKDTKHFLSEVKPDCMYAWMNDTFVKPHLHTFSARLVYKMLVLFWRRRICGQIVTSLFYGDHRSRRIR